MATKTKSPIRKKTSVTKKASAARKPPVRAKAPAKKKPVAKLFKAQAAVKKPVVKKATARPVVKKATARPVVKKATARPAVKKAPAKKATSTKPTTQIIIHFDVGFKNSVFIRGKGAKLSWAKGKVLKNTGRDTWVWETNSKFPHCEFKILINDKEYEAGENHWIQQGNRLEYTPDFSRWGK